MSRVSFESTLEKIGRIIGRSYNLEVLFEGNEAYTDGKRIVLPFFQSIDEEMKADLNGYLDHEAAHCLFTGFETLKKIKTRFHKEMLNAVEDVRIERLMKEEYPGTAFHLNPLNDKMRAKVLAEENWSRLPWPIRTIIAVRDLMEGRAPRIDADIERYVDVVKDAAVELNDCKTTEELRVKTEEIIKKIIEENEEERKESGDGEEGEEGEEGSESKSKSKGSKSGDESSEDEGDSEGSDSDSGGSDSKFDSMLTEKDSEGKSKSEFDKHATSIHDMMKEKMAKAIAEDKKSLDKPVRGGGAYPTPEFGTATSIPSTTRFDKVTDHSGKGDIKSYAKLKDSVRPKVAPIKNTLERVLKVKENAKWRTERERGNLNARDLSRLASDRSYRTPFKEFTRTETNNVAVELLIDLSGSMSGHRIHVAKMSAIAISEALKDLQIPFEVTGFCSEPDRRVAEYTASLGGDASRFNRRSERLDLHVFKRFDSHTLLGLEQIKNGSQNPDGECVAWAAKRLAERKEKRKILMVLSDGQPATGDSDHRKLCTDLKKKIELISKSGIEIIGIGIQTDYVKSFYPDYVILHEVDELPKAGLAKLSKLIQQG